MVAPPAKVTSGHEMTHISVVDGVMKVVIEHKHVHEHVVKLEPDQTLESMATFIESAGKKIPNPVPKKDQADWN